MTTAIRFIPVTILTVGIRGKKSFIILICGPESTQESNRKTFGFPDRCAHWGRSIMDAVLIPLWQRRMWAQAQRNRMCMNFHIYVDFPYCLWKLKSYSEKIEMNTGYQKTLPPVTPPWSASYSDSCFNPHPWDLSLPIWNRMSLCFYLMKQNFQLVNVHESSFKMFLLILY